MAFIYADWIPFASSTKLETPTLIRLLRAVDFPVLTSNISAPSDSILESSTWVFDSESVSPRGQSASETAVKCLDIHEWRRGDCFNTTSPQAADNDGGGVDFSHDDLGDVAGVVAVVDMEALEETRLAKDNHELVREMAVLLVPTELILAGGAAQHAAHDVS